MVLKLVGFAVLVLVVAVAAVFAYARVTGLSARAEPGALETRLATTVRYFAIPSDIRERANPVKRSAEAIEEGLAHFADHCAVCHGNDGSGNTMFGRGLFPKPPDMRQNGTQGHSDGELFYIIENGIRFTGMPAFATGDEVGENDSWRLVHFIRELPKLTPEQLERIASLTPRSPEEIRQEIAEDAFLKGQ